MCSACAPRTRMWSATQRARRRCPAERLSSLEVFYSRGPGGTEMRMLPFALALFLPLSMPASRAIACEEDDHEEHAQDDDDDDEDAERGPRMGVELLELTPELRVFFGAPEDSGLLVSRVESGSPAERAGIRVGDVIYRAAGEQIEEVDQLVR